jgi:hypothetical protein
MFDFGWLAEITENLDVLSSKRNIFQGFVRHKYAKYLCHEDGDSHR